MAEIIFANFATSTLAGPITNTSLTLQVQAGAGVIFPEPSGSQYFVAVLVDAATSLDHEVIWVTNVTSDTFTIVRAQEGTTALSWLAGDIVANRWTAGSAADLVQESQLQAQATNYAADTGSANAITIALSPAPGSLADMVGWPVRTVKVASANTGAMTVTATPLGSGALVRPDGLALIAGEIISSALADFRTNGTNYTLMTPSALTPRLQSGSGNPNGSYAGIAGKDQYIDLSGHVLYSCITSGSTSSAVWVLANMPVVACQIFGTSGTFTVPDTTAVEFELWAGGGGGGGTLGAGSASAAGAGGGYCYGVATGLVPGQTITVTVGAGGAGGDTTPHNGTAGGSSAFGSFGSATGGNGGLGANGTIEAVGPTAGTGTGGSLTFSGQGGGLGYAIGGNMAIAIAGGSFKSPGPGPGVSGTALAGVDGVYPGVGGSGSVLGAAGGAGANGLVIARWVA